MIGLTKPVIYLDIRCDEEVDIFLKLYRFLFGSSFFIVIVIRLRVKTDIESIYSLTHGGLFFNWPVLLGVCLFCFTHR